VSRDALYINGIENCATAGYQGFSAIWLLTLRFNSRPFGKITWMGKKLKEKLVVAPV